jgi:regulator of PEP synthase PpsR (kinase-PPPase family)
MPDHTTTAEILTMSDAEYADHINAIDFDQSWPDHDDGQDEFRDDRGQWAADEDCK